MESIKSIKVDQTKERGDKRFVVKPQGGETSTEATPSTLHNSPNYISYSTAKYRVHMGSIQLSSITQAHDNWASFTSII